MFYMCILSHIYTYLDNTRTNDRNTETECCIPSNSIFVPHQIWIGPLGIQTHKTILGDRIVFYYIVYI